MMIRRPPLLWPETRCQGGGQLELIGKIGVGAVGVQHEGEGLGSPSLHGRYGGP